MKREVLHWPHPKLLQKTNAKVEDVKSEQVQKIIKDLIDTCNVEMGAGLAAPQIGENVQITVLKPTIYGENPDPSKINSDYMVLINPVLEISGEEYEWVEECLSLPGIEGKVIRKDNLVVTYLNEDGVENTLTCEFPLSAAIQHECDHLIGRLWTSRMEKKTSGALKLQQFRKQQDKLARLEKQRKINLGLIEKPSKSKKIKKRKK